MGGEPFLSSSWYRVAGLRPKLRDHVDVRRHRYRGRSSYILTDQLTGQVHRLSTPSYMIVGGMDGTRTVDQLWNDAAARIGEEAPGQDEIVRMLMQLYAADLLQTDAAPDAGELAERASTVANRRFRRALLSPLAIRIPLWDPNRFLDRTLPFTRWLFGWTGVLLWLIVVGPAVVLGAQHWSELTDNASDRILAAQNLVLFALAYPVIKALHELGHGYATKVFGGAVHEMGIMLIVFLPLPYVDASAASGFRSKWRRALVGAAGILVEMFIAALALYVWLLVEPGFLRALSFDVMVVAGVSTVLFNGNPLLRYDGYYILADLLEIPNLSARATRYWGYLVERYAFGTDRTAGHETTRAERIWLLLYAPAAFVYRQAIMLAIALFIASEYLAVGVLLALLSIFTGFVLPVGKALVYLLKSSHLHRNRGRAVATTLGAVAALMAVLFLIPAPLFTTTEGVVWPPESAVIRAATDGFMRRWRSLPGDIVASGDALVESEEPTLQMQVEILRGRVVELEAQLAAERFTDRPKAELSSMELAHARAELAHESMRLERLVIRSRGAGVFAVPRSQDLPGRFFKEGQVIGYVLPPGSRAIRATVRQDDIELVRNRVRGVAVKFAERLDETLPAHIVREVPAGRDELPSKALGGSGGGAQATDPRDTQGLKTLQRVFQFDLELSGDANLAAGFGSRVYVRFNHGWEPVGQQVWRRARQLLLSRLQA